MRPGPSQEEIRRQNLGALLTLVHVRGPMSRAELTSALGLNRSTIGALTADLTGAGLVSEEAPRETRRAGRPSLVVSPRSQEVCAYALSIEVDRVRAARVGLGGVLLDQREAARPPGQTVPEAVPTLAEFVTELRAATPAQVRYVGCGVAVSGQIRPVGDPGQPAPRRTWTAAPIRAGLAEALPAECPIGVGAAADLAVLAEHTRGVAVGYDHIVYLTGQVGIGAGIIVAGRPLTGHGGAAGEVGHMVVRPDGRPCGCGSRGCWETEVNEPALLRAAGHRGAIGGAGRAAVRTVLAAAARGDAGAKAALAQVGGWLGLGVANLVNIFAPDMVIFGELPREVFLAAAASLRSRLNVSGLAGSRAHVRLRTPALGDDAPLIGAAELAFEALLADPLDSSGA